MHRVLGSVLVLLVLSNPAPCQSASPDPILGRWIGQAGPDQDRTEVGFEFVEGDGGGIVPKLYSPVLNVYGAALTMERADGKYRIPEAGMELTLSGDTLHGTMAGLGFPVTLKRARTMPHEVPVPSLPKGPDPLWSTKLGATVYAPVAVSNAVAYIGTTGGVLNAVNIKDGKFVWTFSAGRPIYGEALVAGEALFFVCDNGSLYKLDRITGKEIWRYDLGDALVPRVLGHPAVFDWDYMAPRPVLAAGVIFVGSGDQALHAVDAVTGKRVWRFATKGKVRGSALVDANRVYVGSLDGNVYAVDRKSGAELWHRDSRAPVTSELVMVDGKVIAGNRGEGLLALDPAIGEIVWRAFYWGSWVESAPVARDGLFYIGASDLRRVSCYDPKDGRLVWRTDVFGWSWGLPAVTEKTVYVGVAGGSPYVIRHVPSLTALDRKTGVIRWRWVPPPSDLFQSGFPAGPVIEDSTLVIASIDGTLYGFPITDGGAGAASGS